MRLFRHNYKQGIQGFILYEVLLAITLLNIVGLVWLKWVSYEMQYASDFSKELNFFNNLVYTKNFIAQKIRSSESDITLSSQKIEVNVWEKWAFKYEYPQLYRVLSNGEMQPLSGFGINYASVYKGRIYTLESKDFFSKRDDSYFLYWQGKEKFGNYRFALRLLPDRIYFDYEK